MTAPAARVNQAELARLLGVSRQAIGDLVARGLLTPDPDGLIDVDHARRELANNVRPSSKTALALGTAVVPAAGDAAGAPTGDAPAPEAATSYHVARTLGEAADAGYKQLKLAKLKKDIFQTAEATQAWVPLLAQARETIAQIPARVVPMQIAAILEGNHARAHEILAEELQAALEELCKAPQRLLEAIGESLE